MRTVLQCGITMKGYENLEYHCRVRFLHSLCYTQEDFTHMALGTWVKVVEGKAVALDR